MNNLLSKTDRKQQTIGYGYDALYRLTRKTYPDQTAVGYAYDPLSRLTQVTDPSGAYSFTYDNLGRLLGTGTQYSFLNTALNNSYTYDAASNRISFTNPQSQITNYSYDSLNRLTALADPNTGTFGFGYDALGRRTSLARPNGVDTSYSYDTLSRLLSVLHNGGTLPGSTGYTYDAAGNRTSKTAVQEASPNPVSVLSQYTYDNIYELTQAVVNGSTTEGYSCDAVGNRLTSAGPTTYNYNSSDELTSTSAATYAYDNNGNTTSKTDSTGTTYYTWDFENRLTSVTLPGQGGTVYFTYDPFGRRIRKRSASGTTVYAYDGDNVVQELNSAGSVLADFTQGLGIDEPLGLYQNTGVSYFHADGLGSITSLTSTSGQLAASYVYDSFGNLTASSGSIANPFQYTAREVDSETGLYYLRARYYDPVSGRFLNEDPIQFGGGVNFYSYASNDPGRFVDPYGYLDMYFDTSYTHTIGFWNFLAWHQGNDIWSAPVITASCECEGKEKCKLKIQMRFPIKIIYNNPSTKAHEQRHNKIEEEFFQRQKAKYESFEKTYASATECDYYRQKYAVGFPTANGRLTSDLMKQVLADVNSSELKSAEEEVDTLLERLFYH